MPYREPRRPELPVVSEGDLRSARRARRTARAVLAGVAAAITIAGAVAGWGMIETKRELGQAVRETEACLLGPEPLEAHETPKTRFRRRQLTAMQDRPKAGPSTWPMRCAVPAGKVRDRAAAASTKEHRHLAESASTLERELRTPSAFEADLTAAIDGFHWSPLVHGFLTPDALAGRGSREPSPGEMPPLARPLPITALDARSRVTTTDAFTVLEARGKTSEDGAIAFDDAVVLDTRLASGAFDRTCRVTAAERVVRCAAWTLDPVARVDRPREGDPSFLLPSPAPVLACRFEETAFALQPDPPPFFTFDPARHGGWQPAPLNGDVACSPGGIGWILGRSREVLSVARCSGNRCDATNFDPLKVLGGGSKALAPPMDGRSHASGILGGKLVVAWRSPRGGVRLRIGDVASFASARDVVVVDDRVDPAFGPGSGDTLQFVQIFARQHFAVLVVAKVSGAHLLRVDPDGSFAPLVVAVP